MPHFITSGMQIHLSVTTIHVCSHLDVAFPFHSQVVWTSFLQEFHVHHSLCPWRAVVGGMMASTTLEAFYENQNVVQAVPSPTVWVKLGLLCEKTLMRREADDASWLCVWGRGFPELRN